jgi:bacillithiol biosynthesis cysteine-adding enzyme BshC
MLQKALREYDLVSADASTTAAAAATRVAVDVRRFPWVRPLAGEYAANFASVAPLYAGDPQSPDAWRELSTRVRAHPRDRDQVVAALTAQQRRRLAPEAAQAAAALLASPETVAVVTGQQAGVFGGPLYTILKAVGAIQLARRAAQTLGAPVAPIFWVAAEDHDWEEIAGITVLDEQLQPRTITVPPPEGAGERPVGALVLDERVNATLDELAAALPPTEFTPWLLDTLRAAYRPGVGVADAFAHLIEALLGAHGLVVFDSGDPSVKPLIAGVFRREITAPGQSATLAAKAGEEMTARGHAPQVVPQADAVSLFRIEPATGARTLLKRQGDGFVAGETTISAADLEKELTQAPERFSPNVLLRPVVQDTLFPTICYVAGPSELAYLGQLREVYEHFGPPMPLIHPRASATLVDSATIRFLNKYDVPLEDLQPQDEAALNRLLQAQLPPTVDAAFSAAGQAMAEKMQSVVDAVASVDPTLAGAARNTLGKMEHELKTLQGKMIQAAKRRDDTLRRQFTRAQVQTFPQGYPQERSLSVVHFLNQYGPALIDRLLEELPVDPGQHWVIAI